MANKITTIFDAQDRGLRSSLSNIKKDIASADGAMGKFKAASSGAFGALKANAAAATAAAGAAVVAFAAKSVQAFQESALAAGEFSDATGLSTEEASKWISAAGDIGIAGDDVQKVFLRLNKEIAEGGGVVEQYGISAQKAADGTTNVNSTMIEAIRTVNGIKDETERARVAQELFGRSYANVAELIFQDADQVRLALESTSEQQVFDEEEVEKARRLRAAMDQLGDAVADVQLIIGEQLVPAISDAAETIVALDSALSGINDLTDKIPGPVKKAADAWDEFLNPTKLLNPLGKLNGLLGGNKQATEEVTYASGRAAGTARDFGEATAESAIEADVHAAALASLDGELEAIRSNTQDATDDTDEFAEAMEEAADQAQALERRYSRLKNELNDRSAFLSVKQAFADIGSEAEVTEQDILDLRGTVADYVAGLDNIPPEVLTQIDALVNQGAYEQALAQLNELERTRTTQINIRAQYSQAGSASAPVQPGGGLQVRQEYSTIAVGATGGIVNRPTMAMIGEAGPEAVIPLDKSPGNGPLPSNLGLGGGGVAIHIGTLTTQARNGQQLLDELTAAVRRQGPSGIRRALGID